MLLFASSFSGGASVPRHWLNWNALTVSHANAIRKEG
jgi:hypothetical protein